MSAEKKKEAASATETTVEEGASLLDTAIAFTTQTSPDRGAWTLLVAPDAVAGPIRVTLPALVPEAAPRVFALSRIHPNPFRPNANVAVSLDRDGPFMVRIYRPDGRVVRTLRFATRPAGTHAISWDGRDDRGRSAAAGIYLFELRFGARTRVQKAVLLR